LELVVREIGQSDLFLFLFVPNPRHLQKPQKGFWPARPQHDTERCIAGEVVGMVQTDFGDADPSIGYYRLYFALQRIGRSIMPDIERALKAEGLADPIWFEILLAAEEAGDSGVQMLALQQRLFVRQYALSRHVARMERAGLIRRCSVPGAGRGQTVHLTDAAHGLQARVWDIYRHRIEAAFGDRLSPAEAYAALKLMNRLYP
jgi:DNA-binding MarR family transcriptional regulator